MQAEGAALAFKESQAAMNSAGGGSSTAEFAKMRSRSKLSRLNSSRPASRRRSLKELGQPVKLAPRWASLCGHGHSGQLQHRGCLDIHQGPCHPLDDTNVGLTKLQTKLQETTAAFAWGYRRRVGLGR